MKHLRAATTFAALTFMLVAAPTSAQTPPTAITPDGIKYSPVPFAPGVETAYLAGDGTKPEAYTLRAHLKPDAKMPPHTHPDARMVTVLSGDVLVGTGAKFDPNNGVLLHPGSFFIVPAGTIHWSWAKSGDTVYQETGVGPTGTTVVPQN